MYIKDKEANLLIAEIAITNRWKEYGEEENTNTLFENLIEIQTNVF